MVRKLKVKCSSCGIIFVHNSYEKNHRGEKATCECGHSFIILSLNKKFKRGGFSRILGEICDNCGLEINRDLNASININGREGHSRTYTLVGDCVRPTETKATVDEARTIFRGDTIGSPHHL